MSDNSDDVREDQALVEREHKLDISENKKNSNDIENQSENEKENVIPSLKHNYINDEVQSIINTNPIDELKAIKERIKNENSKIKEINSKLDELNNKNNETTKKRKLELDYNSDILNSKPKQNQNNNILSYSTPRSKDIYITSSDCVSETLNQIHEKMKNLSKMKIGRTNLNELINVDRQLTEKRNKSISKILSEIDKGEKRIQALEEDELRFREEQRKRNEYKIKLFRERELEREKERKKIINKINNISLSQANKYSPKKNYITSAEKEELRKLKEESLLQIYQYPLRS